MKRKKKKHYPVVIVKRGNNIFLVNPDNNRSISLDKFNKLASEKR